MTRSIDINCDMGESYLTAKIGQDDLLMPLISSCNIATGFHGGDPMTIDSTLDMAIHHGVKIGAHPSYPDIKGFGRRPFACTPRDLYLMITYQLGGFMALLSQKGIKLNHVKAHGQLYHDIQFDRPLASAFVSAIQEVDDSLPIVGMPGSVLSDICQARLMTYIGEGFIDRKYDEDGTLKSRSQTDAVIIDKNIAALQALELIQQDTISTLCVHGDNESALVILEEVHWLFDSHDIKITPYS